MVLFLEKFFADIQEKPSSALLLASHPHWKQAFLDEKGLHHHRSIPEMAIRLTKFHLEQKEPPIQLTIRHFRKIIKDYTR